MPIYQVTRKSDGAAIARYAAAQAIALLQSKGFAVSAADILDVKPVAGEVFSG